MSNRRHLTNDNILFYLGDNSDVSDLSEDDEEENQPRDRNVAGSESSSDSDVEVRPVSRVFANLMSVEPLRDPEPVHVENVEIFIAEHPPGQLQANVDPEHIQGHPDLVAANDPHLAQDELEPEPASETPESAALDPEVITEHQDNAVIQSTLSIQDGCQPSTSKVPSRRASLVTSNLPRRRAKAPRRMLWYCRTFQIKAFPGPLDFRMIQVPERVRSPLEYFTEYFDEDFFAAVAECTNMYSLIKSGKSLNTNPTEIKRFFGVNLVMGVLPYPRIRMYWQSKIKLNLITDCMSRDRFLALRINLHCVDINNPQTSENKLWKIQPVIDAVRRGCLNLPRDHVTYSIDEQMIPFTGRCAVKQFVKNKPRPVGLKNFLVTTSAGMVLDFEVYQGPTTPLPDTGLGLGPSVIIRLVETLPKGSYVFFDRYFTTLPLLEHLKSIQIEGTGTIMGNRLKEVTCRVGPKLTRGESREYVRSDNEIVVVEWQDSNMVILASTCFGVEPQEKIKRWSKTEKTYVEVSCPSIVRKYNKCMGGVDLCDQLMEIYRTWFKTKKWTLKCILHFLDLSVVNSWARYMRDCKANKLPKKKVLDLMAYKLQLSEALMSSPDKKRPVLSDSETEETVPVKRSKFYNPPKQIPGVDKRYDGYDHWPVSDDISTPRKCRQENCSSRSKIRCEKCDVYLCLSKNKQCFKDFHVKST